MKKEKDKGLTCNICKCPRDIKIMERNPKTKRMEEKKLTVTCGGHYLIHPRLWNRSGTQVTTESEKFMRTLTYDDYRKHNNRKQS